MTDGIFNGIGVAVTTPFKGGQVDYDMFRKHLTFLKDQNVKSFIINGTTGESTTLTDEEKLNILKIAIEVSDGAIPVIAGTGSNNTQASIEKSVEAQELGVDGLLVITPYYNKTSQRGLLAHFRAIADAVDIPVILYDVPSRTGIEMSVETIAQLSEHPQIAGIKDATGDLGKLTELRLATVDGFKFYSGNDDSAYPFFALGGDGLISVAGNVIPDKFNEIFDNRFENPQHALEVFEEITPFLNELSIDVNPIPIKALTNLIGFGAYELRLPLVPLEEPAHINLVESYRQLRGED